MDLQDAISQALEFAQKALPHENLTVEEVEHDDSHPASWRITIGYKRMLPARIPDTPLGAVGVIERYRATPRYREYEDIYKTIIVPENGGEISMKIRKI